MRKINEETVKEIIEMTGTTQTFFNISDYSDVSDEFVADLATRSKFGLINTNLLCKAKTVRSSVINKVIRNTKHFTVSDLVRLSIPTIIYDEAIDSKALFDKLNLYELVNNRDIVKIFVEMICYGDYEYEVKDLRINLDGYGLDEIYEPLLILLLAVKSVKLLKDFIEANKEIITDDSIKEAILYNMEYIGCVLHIATTLTYASHLNKLGLLTEAGYNDLVEEILIKIDTKYNELESEPVNEYYGDDIINIEYIVDKMYNMALSSHDEDYAVTLITSVFKVTGYNYFEDKPNSLADYYIKNINNPTLIIEYGMLIGATKDRILKLSTGNKVKFYGDEFCNLLRNSNIVLDYYEKHELFINITSRSNEMSKESIQIVINLGAEFITKDDYIFAITHMEHLIDGINLHGINLLSGYTVLFINDTISLIKDAVDARKRYYKNYLYKKLINAMGNDMLSNMMTGNYPIVRLIDLVLNFIDNNVITYDEGMNYIKMIYGNK